jgi:Domain of unknown function (DUF4129)
MVGLALLGLLALVAAGSSGHEWGGGVEDRTVPGAFVDYAFTFAVLLVVGMFALLVWAMTGPSAGVKVERPRGMGVVSFLFVMFALAAYFAYTERNPFREPQAEQPGEAGRPGTLPDNPQGFDNAPGPTFQWWVAILAGVAIAGLVLYERRRRPPPREHSAAEELEEVLNETLEELELDPDPRRAVIQAYVRMESVLAAHGHAREPHEAPLEYLARVLRELDVRAESAHALTELFERARFSQHEIDAAMRAEAVASLEAVRDDLRQAA